MNTQASKARPHIAPAVWISNRIAVSVRLTCCLSAGWSRLPLEYGNVLFRFILQQITNLYYTGYIWTLANDLMYLSWAYSDHDWNSPQLSAGCCSHILGMRFLGSCYQWWAEIPILNEHAWCSNNDFNQVLLTPPNFGHPSQLIQYYIQYQK